MEEFLFHGQATAITAQAAAGSNHTVARNDNGNGIVMIGLPNGARCAGPADLPRDVSIRTGLAIGNAQQLLPHTLLKRSAFWRESEVEYLAFADKILPYLLFHAGHCRGEPGQAADGARPERQGVGVVDAQVAGEE